MSMCYFMHAETDCTMQLVDEAVAAAVTINKLNRHLNFGCFITGLVLIWLRKFSYYML